MKHIIVAVIAALSLVSLSAFAASPNWPPYTNTGTANDSDL
jgi:hypothetical protein